MEDTFWTAVEPYVSAVVATATKVYAEVAPRVHAAWTSFWYPGIEVLPGTAVGCVRVVAHGRVYGIYVPLDVSSWESGLGASVVLREADGSETWLSPSPLPGLRLRLPPSALGAVRAGRVDPLEDEAEEFDADTPLP